MGGRGAGAGSHGAASRWTDEDLGLGGIMDDADGTITDRQLQYIKDLQRKLQELLGPGMSRTPAAGADSVRDIPGGEAPEARRRELAERARERSRRLGAINPERLSSRGASRFIDVV